MTFLIDPPIQPDVIDVTTAADAVQSVRRYLQTHERDQVVHLVVEDEHRDTLVVPRAAVELLGRILAHMAAGEGAQVVPSRAELTTQQAADMLNVSRPYLIGLLDRDEIENRKVGNHRRIKADSLLRYMREDDRTRRGAADELTAPRRGDGPPLTWRRSPPRGEPIGTAHSALQIIRDDGLAVTDRYDVEQHEVETTTRTTA